MEGGNFSVGSLTFSNQGILNAINFMINIYYPVISYYDPVIIICSTVNNALILYVIIRSRLFYQKTSKNVKHLNYYLLIKQK